SLALCGRHPYSSLFPYTTLFRSIPESAAPGRLTKDGVRVLLSRAYLYMGQWQNCIDVASQVTKPIAARDKIVGVWEDSNKDGVRSEEHTSELQSRENLVCRLLLE